MTPKSEDTRLITARFAVGLAIGLTLGFFLGVMLDSFGLGIPIGMGLGVAGVWLFDRLQARRQDRRGPE